MYRVQKREQMDILRWIYFSRSSFIKRGWILGFKNLASLQVFKDFSFHLQKEKNVVLLGRKITSQNCFANFIFFGRLTRNTDLWQTQSGKIINSKMSLEEDRGMARPSGCPSLRSKPMLGVIGKFATHNSEDYTFYRCLIKFKLSRENKTVYNLIRRNSNKLQKRGSMPESSGAPLGPTSKHGQ